MLKYIYIFLGSISLCLGFMGFVTPGLPITPFILLTGVLYAKGSPRLHKMLSDNKITGPYLRRMNTGVSLKMKIFSITLMWTMICFTVFVAFANNPTMQFVMIGLGVIGTVCQLIFVKRRKTIPQLSAEEESTTK